jgi:tripartite-type tricarboxylate transporter receptor subunit TctC
MTAFHARITRSVTVRLGIAALTAALAAIAPDTSAQAQPYPNRPITIVLPLAAGSGMDSLARLYGDQLSQALGKPVIIDNRPGASLMLAAAAVATAPPDGYTLLVSTAAPMAINPTLYKQVNYNPEKDFEPISLYVKSPFVLVVDPALPVRTVPELIKYVKESGKPLTYSSPGAGLAQHLSMEFMKQRFGLEITHVPYRNTPQSVADIAAGHVNMGFAEAGVSVPLIKDGKLRALAVSSSTRLGVLPDVPPFSEAANAPDYEAVSWHLLLAPAGTPKDIIDRLHQEMKKIMAAPDMKKKIADLGLIPLDTPSLADTQAYLASERVKWSALVRKLGLQATQ